LKGNKVLDRRNEIGMDRGGIRGGIMGGNKEIEQGIVGVMDGEIERGRGLSN
jgi:hypothetical protein